MSTNRLVSLPQFSYTALDFDTIVEDVKKLIKENPEYNAGWDDFLESNAGRLFTEVMSFIIEKLSARVDWVVQELFISTATQRQSLINLLKLIGHRPSLPKAAKINVKAKLTKWVEPFSLPIRETVLATDTNGDPTRFECIQMADDGKPNYDFQYLLDTGTDTNRITEIYNIPFYQGQTRIEEDIYTEGVDNEKIELEYYPVIENSIRVISVTSGKEALEVESFISAEAQQSDLTEAEQVPPYIIEIDDENRVTINWGKSSIVKIPSKNERWQIIYRVGGGKNTNIVSGALNTMKTYTVDDNKRVTTIFTNPDGGFGGSDEEDLEDAKLIAPISLRSANKTVTEEDYISHLELDPLVMHAYVVGKENEPEDIYEEYGYHLPPLDTWIYICPEKEAWNEINPREYNKVLQIDRPYSIHKEIDYEDVSITTLDQVAYLTKYHKYSGYVIYVTLHETSTECTEYMFADSYQDGIDFNLDSVNSTITRVATADGGTIPSGDRTLRVRYISDSNIATFKTNTVKTFSGDQISLDTVSNSLYPKESIKVMDMEGNPYTKTTDYTIDYELNKINRVIGGNIPPNSTVIIYYANNWLQDENDASEENYMLDIIKNKKMICVDNYIKDSVYSPFDIVATIHCYKNMRTKVTNGLKTYLKEKYNLKKAKYNFSIPITQITLDIMKYAGVRFVEISYYGKNYEAYRRYVLGEITLSELQKIGGEHNTNTIPCKYNEILILSDDEYSGNQILENQRHGMIFTYRDYS